MIGGDGGWNGMIDTMMTVIIMMKDVSVIAVTRVAMLMVVVMMVVRMLRMKIL